MTLNDKTRDIDLELAETMLSRPWEHSRACPSLDLPQRTDRRITDQSGRQAPHVPSLLWVFTPMIVTVTTCIVAGIFQDELSAAGTEALSTLRFLVLTWLGFPEAV